MRLLSFVSMKCVWIISTKITQVKTGPNFMYRYTPVRCSPYSQRAFLDVNRRQIRATPGSGPMPVGPAPCYFPGMEWRMGQTAKRPDIIEPCVPTVAPTPPVGAQWFQAVEALQTASKVIDGEGFAAALRCSRGGTAATSMIKRFSKFSIGSPASNTPSNISANMCPLRLVIAEDDPLRTSMIQVCSNAQ
jgi:hypothetical protein